MSPAFGPAPRPTWWGYAWLDDTLFLFSRLLELRPCYQMEWRWRRAWAGWPESRGEQARLDVRTDQRLERAPCVIRSCGVWRGLP